MKNIFVNIYDFFQKHKRLYVLCLILVFLVATLGAIRVRFVDDINKMIPHNASIEAMNNVINNSKVSEQIIFSLSFKDSNTVNPDSLIVLQQELQQNIENNVGKRIKSIKSQINEDNEQALLDIVLQHLPLFLEKDDYQKIDTLIQSQHIKSAMKKNHELLLSPAGIVAKDWIAQDPIGMVPIALDKLKNLNQESNYQLNNGYIFDNKLQQLTFFIELNKLDKAKGNNQKFLTELDKVLSSFKAKHLNVKINYFGAPAVAAANAAQIRQDTLLTLSITIVLLLALTFYVFKKKRAPFVLMLPVLFGAVFGMAISGLFQTDISGIALGAGAIILGIAIDFSVHFMSHARIHPDMRDNIRSLVAPLTLGALTTVGAFFALRFSNAPLLRDLGLFAAASLTGASMFTLIFLPHLIKAENKKVIHHKPNFIDKIAQLKPEGNKWLLTLVILATPVMWYFANDVKFDSDLMHLNYLSPELKVAQDELNQSNSYALSSIFVVAKANTEDAALNELSLSSTKIQQLLLDGKIKSYTNPASILPSKSEQEIRLARWNTYWTNHQSATVENDVLKYATEAGFSSHAFDDFNRTLHQTYTTFDSSTISFFKDLMPTAVSEQKGKHYAVATLKVAPEYRKEVLTTLEQQKNIVVTDRQSVSEKLLDLLKQDFNHILIYSALLVFVALLIAYGRIELALISFLPLALTWVWITGIMSIFGLQFNIVNIIICTLIFGLGDDYSIFMMDSLMEKYRTGKTNIAHARSAVYLSVLTTIIGLGTLIFAKHPALHSIAVIAITGLICVVFVSQVLQPFLFNFMIQHRADKGFMPFTLWSFSKSVFAFLYFFTGCVLVWISGLILISFKPFGKKKSKWLFHFFLSKYTGSVMYIMANLRKRVVRLDTESFKQPAIYIANHTSFLDILLTTMLHPKLVLLTNHWVWRSPFFGKIVRMAEYYPVADGATDSIEPLKDLVSRGYGIVVFPEGTRSRTDDILRFHKGAFYVAEQLQLDVVPLLLHGVHYTMQKGDWLLKDGTTTVKIYSPMQHNDDSWGDGFAVRTKNILKWFRNELNQEKIKNETPKYFYEQLTKGNLYKGPVLEWYCKVKVRLENYYEPFHALLPRNGKFYDLGCGNGFMSLMLHWAAPDRHFVGVDYDEEKVANAQNHYARNAKFIFSKKAPRGSQYVFENPAIRFETADVTQFSLQACNGIIISDVLHYLVPKEQEALLNRAYEALLSNGILIIRDGMKELEKRHEGTVLTEKFSTKIFKFNKINNELHFLSRSFLEAWATKKSLKIEVIDNAKNTSNLIFIFRKLS